VRALRGAGAADGAEDAAYVWRDAAPALGGLYLEIFTQSLADDGGTLSAPRLARFSAFALSHRLAAGAGALGWRFYRAHANGDAIAWFEHALAWAPEGPPAKKVAVLACMDARLVVGKILGLEEGDAHVIRNAGGVATDDAIRSLVISQRLLGTEEIILIHHTGCGMLTFTDDEFRNSIEEDTGIKPEWAAEAFGDLDQDVRQSIARIKASPFVPNKNSVRGFVYEVETGKLREVS